MKKKKYLCLCLNIQDIGWWYWLVTALLLAVGVLGNELGFILAIGLTIFQLFIMLDVNKVLKISQFRCVLVFIAFIQWPFQELCKAYLVTAQWHV